MCEFSTLTSRKMKKIEDGERELEIVNQEINKLKILITGWTNEHRKLEEKINVLNKSIKDCVSISLPSVDWARTNYEWSKDVNRILKDIFKIHSFRQKQLSAINATLANENALVVMPTGAGKSLCYQLPCLVNPGITIVISPLISLMEDQARSLSMRNIPAKILTSSSPEEELVAVLNLLVDKNDPVKLLYITAEILVNNKRLLKNLQICFAQGRLQRIAIDEVHCCSQWGHDFRADYQDLDMLSNMFPSLPILGLTATATEHVLSDVQEILKIQGCLVIKSFFNRPNLFYKILEKPSSQEECTTIVENLLKYRYKGESGIIYANSVEDCEDLTQELRKRGLKVGCCHENMKSESRTKVHVKWHKKYYQAIVATSAFGIGIDKPDVRFIIHHTISKSLENYYQESGRAGRDGLRAECITLYRMQDIFKVSPMVFSSTGGLDHLYGMVNYCVNGILCRRQVIAENFDDDWRNAECNKMCDICCNPNIKVREISLKNHCITLSNILTEARNTGTNLTAEIILDIWFLKSPLNSLHKGKEPNFARNVGEDIIAFLLVREYLVEDIRYTAKLKVSYLKEGPSMVTINDEDFTLSMPVRKYIYFVMDNPAPRESEGTKQLNDEIKRKGLSSSKKRSSSDEPKTKKSKPISIDSDDD